MYFAKSNNQSNLYRSVQARKVAWSLNTAHKWIWQKGLRKSNMANREEEVNALKHAVRLASQLCSSVQMSLTARETASKYDASPVTAADYASQIVITEVLKEFDAKDGCEDVKFRIVAEEDSSDLKDDSYLLDYVSRLVNQTLDEYKSARLSHEQLMQSLDLGGCVGGPSIKRFWTVDPIDGTRGFVSGRHYTVAAALIEDGQVQVSVLGCPNLSIDGGVEVDRDGSGTLFWAIKGRGAYMEPCICSSGSPSKAEIQQLKMSSSLSPVRLVESYGGVCGGAASHERSATVLDRLNINTPSARLDSQAKYGILCRNDASIYLRFPPEDYTEKIWDHAPGTLIIQESGGIVTDGLGKPLDFNCGRFLALGGHAIVASPSDIHGRLLEALT